MRHLIMSHERHHASASSGSARFCPTVLPGSWRRCASAWTSGPAHGAESAAPRTAPSGRGGGLGERGGSWSLLVLLLVVSFTLGAGLVVDGNRKAAAVRVAMAAASDAARAGVDASATSRLAGRADTGAAVSAARTYLRSVPDISGSVTVLPGGRLRVEASQTVTTRYVSLIGIDSLTGRGEAEAELLDTGGG